MIIWIHYSYTCEFICEMNIWIHEYMNSCVWIQMYRFWILIWIHKYMNSDIRIHCILSEFMNLISLALTWIHDMNSILKIAENSMSWIHGIEFSSEIWHMNSLRWIQKNHVRFLLWIHSQLVFPIFHGRFYGFILKALSSSSIQSAWTLVGNASLVVQSRFQLHIV